MSAAEKKIKSQVDRNREWLAKINKTDWKQRNLSEAVELLASSDAYDVRKASDRLGSISRYEGISGVLKILDGAPDDGWLSVDHSVSLSYWKARIRIEWGLRRVRAIQERSSLEIELAGAACLACFGILCESDWAEPMLSFLDEARKREEVVRSDFWNERSFEPFVLNCFSRSGTSVQEIVQGIAGPYVDLFSENEVTVKTIQRMCDFHCDRMFKKGQGYPEFETPPFDLLPVEVFAIGRKFSFDMSTIPHPLMALTNIHTHTFNCPRIHPLSAMAEQAYERIWQ